MPKNFHVPSNVLSAKFGYAFLNVDKSAFQKTDQEKKRLKLLKQRQNIKGRKFSTVIAFNCNTQ